MTRAQLAFEFGQLAFRDFECFEPGANGEAVALLERAAAGEPLQVFLHGGAGSGKTHLLTAACERARTRGASVVYLPIAGLASRSPRLLDGLGARQLVCVDDLDAAVGDPHWEQALFRVYEACEAAGGALVLAASVAPATFQFCLQDLGSRLRAALAVGLVPLDDRARAGALARLARTAGFELSAEVAQYLLRRAPRDMHSLAALVEGLDRASLAAQRRVTVPFARDWLAERRAGTPASKV